MKKRFPTLVYLLILSVSTSTAWAQTSPWTLGLKAGTGWSGRNVEQQTNQEIRDRYRSGFSYAGGLRLGYRLAPSLALRVDAEWQSLCDRRVRALNVLGLTDVDRLGPLIYTTTYDNTFQRLQVPLTVEINPFPQRSPVYVLAGAMPTYFIKAKTHYKLVSSREDDPLASGSLTIPFSIRENEHLRNDLLFIAGVGTSVGKKIALEAVYQFNNPLRYAEQRVGGAFILLPTYTSRAGQGLLVTATYRLFWILGELSINKIQVPGQDRCGN
ncbi:hypothetical protein GCM10027275_05670 [Rhabdobacter roseus]|uniref:Outer membrane protein beta-barrel domain-containing protein n=1 Tax=Rhabdobacter roseus TaxID=1655419 RepID=A0A840TKX7_9BACT|nr:outer membrane beta-barrel protein [Rhabdobacter roseus]MBB5282457.1 hypothetical protein [Rhabdobacter roseus]